VGQKYETKEEKRKKKSGKKKKGALETYFFPLSLLVSPI
jgi:hypothetical protein